MPNPSLESSNTPIHLLKMTSVGLLTLASSLSVPIVFNIFSSANADDNAHKILKFALPYLMYLPFRAWLVWHFIGQRLDGSNEQDIQRPDNTFKDTPEAVLVAMIANLASFTNAFATGYVVFQKNTLALQLTASFTLGALNYLNDIYTEVIPAFRKYADSQKDEGQAILPFLNQRYSYYLGKYALPLGQVIREALPIIRGLIFTKTTLNIINDHLSDNHSKHVFMLINTLLSLLVYSSAAYSARFEIVQLRDNLAVNQVVLKVEPYLNTHPNPLLAIIGKISNGALMLDVLKTLKCSHRVAVQITLFFTALGMSSLIQEIFQTYVSSTKNTSENTLVINHMIGNTQAYELAPKIEPVFISLSIFLGFIATYAKRAVLFQYHLNNDRRIYPEQAEPNLPIFLGHP